MCMSKRWIWQWTFFFVNHFAKVVPYLTNKERLLSSFLTAYHHKISKIQQREHLFNSHYCFPCKALSCCILGKSNKIKCDFWSNILHDSSNMFRTALKFELNSPTCKTSSTRASSSSSMLKSSLRKRGGWRNNRKFQRNLQFCSSFDLLRIDCRIWNKNSKWLRLSALKYTVLHDSEFLLSNFEEFPLPVQGVWYS